MENNQVSLHSDYFGDMNACIIFLTHFFNVLWATLEIMEIRLLAKISLKEWLWKVIISFRNLISFNVDNEYNAKFSYR
jgi:hypothetical protein